MKSMMILLFFLLMDPYYFTDLEVKVISFNIRYGTADDGSNSWPQRRDILFNFVRNEDADFLGLQEAMMFQVEEILRECPGYKFIGRTREADGISGEATPILYREAGYELIEQGTRWLSETPGEPASKSWDSSLPRIFTWAHFRRKKDAKDLIVYNTHYDHLGETARLESSKVIVAHMDENHKGLDIILLGDCNALEDSEPIRYLTENNKLPLLDAYRKLHPGSQEKDMTFYGWNAHLAGTGKRIDYIFYAGLLKPEKAYVSDYHENNYFPSDHMPVVATFTW
jgi:endonuclease/exonuclease/phosphatase family metal-dependent hydrolase